MEWLRGWWDADSTPADASESSGTSESSVQADSAHGKPQDHSLADSFDEEHSYIPDLPSMLSPRSVVSFFWPDEGALEGGETHEDKAAIGGIDKACPKSQAEAAGRTKFITRVYPGSDASLGSKSTSLEVNSTRSLSIESEFWNGEVLFLHKESNSREGLSPYADHFAAVKRQFEIRFQFVFKKVPKELFIVGEVRKSLGLSSLSLAAVKPLIAVGTAIAAARSAPVSYNIDAACTIEETAENHARPHWAVPIYAANFVQRTPPGETPPSITQAFEENPRCDRLEAIRSLRSGDTLTVAFWDMYMNFELRELCNMPLGLNASFDNIVGDQPFHIAIYDWVGEGSGMSRLHMQADRDYLITIVPCQVTVDEDNESEDRGSSALLSREADSCKYGLSECWHAAFTTVQRMFLTCSQYGGIRKRVGI